MPFIPVPNGVQLCFDFLTAGQNWQFCLTLRKSSGAPTPSDLATATSTGEVWWTNELADLLHANTTLRQIRATDLTVQGGVQDTNVVGTDGALTGGAVPLGTPIVVSLRTAKRGRSYRGRVYVSGLANSQVADETDIGGGVATNFGTAFGVLASALDVVGFDVVVASRQHNGVTTNPAEANEVTAYVVDTHFDSQRRRLAGRGT